MRALQISKWADKGMQMSFFGVPSVQTGPPKDSPLKQMLSYVCYTVKRKHCEKPLSAELKAY